jgi:hypothetical protein
MLDIKVNKEETTVDTVEDTTGFIGKVPAHWSITANADNTIVATNSTTGEIFEGNISTFNEKMRG